MSLMKRLALGLAIIAALVIAVATFPEDIERLYIALGGYRSSVHYAVCLAQARLGRKPNPDRESDIILVEHYFRRHQKPRGAACPDSDFSEWQVDPSGQYIMIKGYSDIPVRVSIEKLNQTLEFPYGTSKDVIKATVMQRCDAAKASAAPSKPPTGLTKEQLRLREAHKVLTEGTCVGSARILGPHQQDKEYRGSEFWLR